MASGKTSYIAVTAIIVIFQPELRKALEQIGSQNVLTTLFSTDDTKKNEDFSEKTIAELVRACFEMGKVKTGALIVIERGTAARRDRADGHRGRWYRDEPASDQYF